MREKHLMCEVNGIWRLVVIEAGLPKLIQPFPVFFPLVHIYCIFYLFIFFIFLLPLEYKLHSHEGRAFYL